MSDEWDGSERRSTPRDELVNAIACAVREELANLTVPEKEHRKHHEFIDEWLAEIQRKKARREAVRTQVYGWGVITLLGGIGTVFYQIFQYFKEHLR